MNKLMIYILFPFLLLTLAACSVEDTQKPDQTNEASENTTSEEAALTAPDSQELPDTLTVKTDQGIIQTESEVLILFDKYELTVGEDTSSTAKIHTSLEDWSYTVEAEYGTIMEETDTSFKYVISDDFEQDTIRVILFDKIQKIQISQVFAVRLVDENGRIVYKIE